MRLPCGEAGAAAPILWGSQACCTAALAVEAAEFGRQFASRAGAPRRKLVLQWVLGASAALPLLGALLREASAASPRMDACEQNPDLQQHPSGALKADAIRRRRGFPDRRCELKSSRTRPLTVHPQRAAPRGP